MRCTVWLIAGLAVYNEVHRVSILILYYADIDTIIRLSDLELLLYAIRQLLRMFNVDKTVELPRQILKISVNIALLKMNDGDIVNNRSQNLRN